MCAACSNDLTEDENNATKGGERYMAISLVTGTGNNTRGDTDESEYEDGTDNEYAADKDKIYFFFFDNAGIPVSVTEDGDNFVTGTGFEKWDKDGSNQSVTALSNVITVLETKVGVTPTQMVAVVNATFTPTKCYLSDLRKQIVESSKGYTKKDDGTTYFMMSNSAYHDGTSEVYTTPIKPENLRYTADESQQNPVKVYVERVVAKVTLGEQDDKIELKDTENYKKVYEDGLWVKISGWKLFNTASQTYLIKDIDGIYGTSAAYDGWNSDTNFRSFWATVPSDLSLSTDSISWKEINDAGFANEYPFENTSLTVTKDGKTVDNHTCVALAGTLVDKGGKAVEIGKWLSNYYTTDGLKTAIANFLATSLYTYDKDATAEKWSSVTAEDITLNPVNKKGYDEVKAGVVSTKSWYKSGSTTALTETELEAILDKVPTASLWKDGKCYYFAEITHTNGSPAVVRNHEYQVKISSIQGLGTPVYDPDEKIDPIRPDDTETWYLDAKMYVQAWKIVKNNIDFKTTTNN
jgi:hypothetical protein